MLNFVDRYFRSRLLQFTAIDFLNWLIFIYQSAPAQYSLPSTLLSLPPTLLSLPPTLLSLRPSLLSMPPTLLSLPTTLLSVFPQPCFQSAPNPVSMSPSTGIADPNIS